MITYAVAHRPDRSGWGVFVSTDEVGRDSATICLSVRPDRRQAISEANRAAAATSGQVFVQDLTSDERADLLPGSTVTDQMPSGVSTMLDFIKTVGV